MDQLSDDELATELRRAILLGTIAENAGEADAANIFASTQRALENEQRLRREG